MGYSAGTQFPRASQSITEKGPVSTDQNCGCQHQEGVSPPGCLIAMAVVTTEAFTKGGTDSAMCFAAFCEFTSAECLDQKTNTTST